MSGIIEKGPQKIKKAHHLDKFFYPESLAVIGVSIKRLNLGQIILLNNHRLGFKGKLYGVGKEAGEIEGVPVYADVRDLPETPDVAIIITPARTVPDLDLRGRPQHDYDVHIQGGIGEAVVRLPAGAGVYANANGGIGEIKTRGLKKEGDHWENDAYATAKVKVRVDVQGGIGSITLIGDSD